jgi:hypothetical protein
MGWKDLLQKEGETVVLPWLGGRVLRSGPRSWALKGKLPDEDGWYAFSVSGRDAKLVPNAPAEPRTVPPGSLEHLIKGYLVGDRLVKDDAAVDPDPGRIAAFSEPVSLIEPGLDRFARVQAGRSCEDGPLVYEGMDMPLGPEDEVLRAYEDRLPSVDGIKGVTPALDAAFRMVSWQRSEAERRRAELERQRLEEERRLAAVERMKKLAETLGDGAGRREIAATDFAEAARAALAVGGAEYLDHRAAHGRNEMVVRFRLNRRRFECTCDRRTLRIVDAGICLTAHYDDGDFDEGTRGDTFFTLESLPGVILEAEREGKLVVFRHVD